MEVESYVTKAIEGKPSVPAQEDLSLTGEGSVVDMEKMTEAMGSKTSPVVTVGGEEDLGGEVSVVDMEKTPDSTKTTAVVTARPAQEEDLGREKMPEGTMTTPRVTVRAEEDLEGEGSVVGIEKIPVGTKTSPVVTVGAEEVIIMRSYSEGDMLLEANRSSLASDKIVRGKAALLEEGEGEGSVATGALQTQATGSSTVVEIEEATIPLDHSMSGPAAADGKLEVEKGSCSSWFVDMEKARWSQQCIYRVPEFIKKMTGGDAYQPRFVSLGPLHHGDPGLVPMEEHKRRAVLHLVNRAGKPLGEFVAAIEEVAGELQAAYCDLDAGEWRGSNTGRFVEMMVTDGCFLLELTRKDEIISEGETDDDYAADDPIFSDRTFPILWPIMRTDMIAMENQLPLVVLERLLAVQHGTSVCPMHINFKVSYLMKGPSFEACVMHKLGLHFLDVYHKCYCGKSMHWEGVHEHEPRTQCAIELSEAGIQFKRSQTKSIHDVDFKDGVLSMPELKLHDSLEAILLNLMAYEWLHPNADHDVASYIAFVDKIIESERDVALLRSEGIFMNLLGSDKKVVEMFHNLTQLALCTSHSRLGHVQRKVNVYCRKPWNRWRASFTNTYLSNPWVFISLMAAIFLLVAALLQTIYTILSFYKG